MTKVAYSIPHIRCGHCVHALQMELSELEGVRKVVVSESEQQVEIPFEPPLSET